MKLAVLYFAAACALPALLLPRARADRAEPRDDAGIVQSEPTIRGTSIRWVRTKNVDVDFGDVVSLGRRKKAGAEPKGTHSNTLGDPMAGGGERKDDSKRVSTEDKSPKTAAENLTEKFPTGARVDGKGGNPPYEGLIQSQNDVTTGNVAVIEIPGQGTINSPVKADGSPLTQLDLMRLGRGYVNSIALRNGQTIYAPGGAVPG